jgi:hypothetical protein
MHDEMSCATYSEQLFPADNVEFWPSFVICYKYRSRCAAPQAHMRPLIVVISSVVRYRLDQFRAIVR